MPDLNLQLILDKLTLTVKGVTPRVVSTIPFVPNTSNKALDDLEENAIRVFEWRDGDLTTQDNDGTPKADSSSTWYTLTIELALIYPTAFQVPGDDAAKPRGLTGMRLVDAIDLNKALMFNDPLAAAVLTGDYMLLQLLRSTRSGRVRSLFYRLVFQEDLT